MKIGITGANGFIGSHLLRSCIARGDEPVAFLQKGTSLQPIEDLDGKYEAIWGDVLDPKSVDDFVGRCENVFHLAGFNRYWAPDRSVFSRVNEDGARNVGDACLRHGVAKLVHASSCITLGASDEPIARNEDSPFNLSDIPFPYATTKKAGEEIIRELARKRGLPAVIVHPTSAIGERDYGPTPIGKPISDISNGMWPVYVAGGACFIDIADVVRGFWLALEKGRPGENYLLAGENMTNRQFMTAVAQASGVSEPKIKVPKPFLGAVALASEFAADHFTKKHPPLTRGMNALIGRYLYFDGKKAEAELGFKAGPAKPAIARAVEWFRQTGTQAAS